MSTHRKRTSSTKTTQDLRRIKKSKKPRRQLPFILRKFFDIFQLAIRILALLGRTVLLGIKIIFLIFLRMTPVNRVGLLIFGIGILFFGVSLSYHGVRLPESKTVTIDPIQIDQSLTKNTAGVDIPTRILLPHVGIDIPVKLSHVIHGYWELSEMTASYGEGSGVPGNPGNAVIFAHARQGLFLPLKDVSVGDRVYLFTQNKYFMYTVTEKKEVSPTDIYVIKPTDIEQLTLYTCSGFIDSKRLVVTARPTQ